MITPSEAGLTQEQYDAIQTGRYPVAKRMTLRRRNLDFSTHDSAFTTGGYTFDLYFNESEEALYRVQNEGGTLKCWRLANEDAGDESWVQKTDIDTGIDGVRPSFDGDGAVFYVKGGSIYRATTADQGTSWSTSEIVNLTTCSISGTITHVAGAGNDVFFAVYQSDYNTAMYHSTNPFGLGYVYDSGIYIPHRFTGFDAIETPESTAAKPKRLVVISTEMPIQIGTEAEGTSVTTIGYKREGLLAFLCTNQRWSEHFVIEQFDNATAYQTRRYPMLSRVTREDGAQVFACVSYGVDGNANYHNQALHYTFSCDGKYWSQHELLTLEGQSGGGKLLVNGDYAYIGCATSTHRSYTTELTGDPPGAICEDITARVLTWSAEHGNGRSSSWTLANHDDWFRGSMLPDGGLFSIKTEWGIYLGGSAVLFPFGVEGIDTYDESEKTPSKTLQMGSRDNIARLNNEVHSSQAVLTDNQTVGADQFVDSTDTGYGGMAHTAALSGSWKTTNNWLELASNNKRGAAKTTFNLNVWNGMIQAAFRITESGSSQFAGLIFRAYDKSNFYSAEYRYSNGTLYLYEIRGGEKTTLASVSGLGFSLGTTYYLRVLYRYSHVIVETSTDGKTWTQRIDEIVPGKDPDSGATYLTASATVSAILEDGGCGVTGRGYAPNETWSPDPYIPEDWDWDFDDDDFEGEINPPPISEPDPIGEGSGLKNALCAVNRVLVSTEYGIVLAGDISAASPHWTPVMNGLPKVWGTPAYWTPRIKRMYLDTFDPGAAYVLLHDDGIELSHGVVYYNPDWRNNAAWEPLLTWQDVVDSGVTNVEDGHCLIFDALVSFAQQGLIYVIVARSADSPPNVIRVYRDQDGVVDVQYSPKMYMDVSPSGDQMKEGGSIALSHTNPDKIWVQLTHNGGTGDYKDSAVWSAIWGTFLPMENGHWTEDSQFLTGTFGNNLLLHPYFKLDGSLNDDTEFYYTESNNPGTTDNYIHRSANGVSGWSTWTVLNDVPTPVHQGFGNHRDRFDVPGKAGMRAWWRIANKLRVLKTTAMSVTEYTVPGFDTDAFKGDGFTMHWPFNPGQYYASQKADYYRATPPAILKMTLNADNGVWNNITGNMWSYLDRANQGGDGNMPDYADVVGFCPHWSEK